MNDQYTPGREQLQATAAPNIATERARNDPQASVNSLLASLGSQSTQGEIANFTAQDETRKLEEQKVKFDWYVEQFQKDHDGGAVSQAQVKGRFPETVPIISSRIAEAVGAKAGKDKFAPIMEEIAGNDALRLDTTARAAFIANKRAEIVAAIPEGNEFYGAGVVSALDKTMARHEMTWQTETAAFHEKVQADQFTNDVIDALNTGKPEALTAVDGKYRVSSSLNDQERKKLTVEAAIDHAFTSDDLSVLDTVPEQFLNAEYKDKLVKARLQITDRRMSDFRNARYLEQTRRDEESRKFKVEIVGQAADGGLIDPAKYRDDPDAFQFALQMREVSRLNASQSVANAQKIRNEIVTGSTIGDSASLPKIIDGLVANRDLNPPERQALINELPKLIEGRNLMADDMVRQPITDRLAPRLTALESSTNSAIQTLLTGRNIRSEVMRGYDLDIRRMFTAEFEETGQWPTGHRKLQLIDKAVDRAEKRLEDATKISSLSSPSTGASPAKPSVAPKLPKGVSKID